MTRIYSLILLLLISYQIITAMASSNAVTHISEGNDKFSSELYNILSKSEGNVFYSPISVHAILSLVYQGAVGATAKSFEKALHLSNTKLAAEGYQNLMEKLNSVEDVKLHIANKVYIQEKYKLKNEFSAVAKNNFLSEAENVNFAASGAAAKLINDWVEGKTNKKITNLISPSDLDSLTRLVLVNAIYFKGDWMHKFQPSLTKKEKFYLSETETVDCDMMHMNRKFRYGEDADLDAQILNLPYKNPNLSLIIILPKSKTGIKDLEKKLANKSLSAINSNLYSADIILSLPKFKIETKMDLNGPLSDLGMDIIFNKNAEFPNLLDSPEELCVSKVVQKAFIEVNEEGAEAAAATGIQISVLSLQPEYVFKADHPFAFALAYKQNKQMLPLFVGKLNKI